ncbi:GNAT family N-acetyltransferase [Nocardioides caldifontis]|uniref:GNAT family N-acetyltransferase n=1 Tax=Nocardioides caldifontis TaxID=2588938 RepID=UPI0011DF69AF|nr:GNAT family N-acetyltransferase [Nocardioides caldifontis]
MAKTPVEIRHDREAHRVEAVLEDGRVAGFAEYRPRTGTVHSFTHTEVGDEFEGQGIGSQLARGVVQTARDEGFRILPSCSFLRGYLRGHEELQDVLAPGARLEPDAEQPAG